ncbi:MAG TPA: ribose-phosphate pyrophosphokinase [Vicinamibacterales bacterium]|nr:ribose-phosphate pyrophosphokinase [Vicinamibacterales bacterium]
MPLTLALLAGTANPDLAANVAQLLGSPFGGCPVQAHPDGELQADLRRTVRGCDVYLVQSTAPRVETHLLELLLITDACRRAGASRITAIVPYLGYARQERRTGATQSLGARVMARILDAAPPDRLVVVDLHAPALEGFFSMPVDHLTAVPLLADAARPAVPDDAVLVAPDLGAVKLAERYARLLDRPLAVVHKTRQSGRDVSVRQIVGDVRGRSPIIVDDMISTGATIAAAMTALLAAGCRPHALVVATHGLFVAGAEEQLLSVPIRNIMVTDSIARTAGRLPVQTCSLSALLAEAVRGLHSDRIA